MTSIRPTPKRTWHVAIGDGRVQTAVADATDEAFHRALRPTRLVPVSMVAGLMAVLAVAGAGVTTAYANEPAAPSPSTEPPPASSPPHADRDPFYPERHVGRLDPEVLERLRQDEVRSFATSPMRRGPRRGDPLQLTR